MPGITIDRFQNFTVLQLLSAGAEYQRPALLSALQHCYPECSIYDRSDVAVRKRSLPLAQGPVLGDLPPELLPITEHGMKLLVDIQQGHKTGFYLDQRDSRGGAQLLRRPSGAELLLLHRRLRRFRSDGRLRAGDQRGYLAGGAGYRPAERRAQQAGSEQSGVRPR